MKGGLEVSVNKLALVANLGHMNLKRPRILSSSQIRLPMGESIGNVRW